MPLHPYERGVHPTDAAPAHPAGGCLGGPPRGSRARKSLGSAETRASCRAVRVQDVYALKFRARLHVHHDIDALVMAPAAPRGHTALTFPTWAISSGTAQGLLVRA